MKTAHGWSVHTKIRFSSNADSVLSKVNQKIGRRERHEARMRALRSWYFRFQDLFEAAHRSGVEVIGGGLQVATIVLIVVVAAIQTARYFHAHPLPLHFFGW